jgi:hypothetical protein
VVSPSTSAVTLALSIWISPSPYASMKISASMRMTGSSPRSVKVTAVCVVSRNPLA